MANDSKTKAHHITLNDRTTTQKLHFASPSIPELSSDAERSDSELVASSNASTEPLVRKTTSSSLRDNLQQQINRQKYARYQSYRYDHSEQEVGTNGTSQPKSTPQGVIERGRARAAELLRRKKTLGRGEERDAVLDILYENQRGSFLFGVPRYSSKSLLQFDPKPWQNADFRTSAVDIRNAQLPDPSWQWAWKSWYVDMSRDVDEEGWEYSLAFPIQFAWHGNHPWFHSFVRRRRWLRKRVRKDILSKTKEKSHELAPDYFTIHTKVLSAGSQTERGRNPLHLLEEEKLEEAEIPDILTLLRFMSKARIDREKLTAIRRFIDEGGEDLHYLADRMPQIMSLFVYQSSRQQLLAEMVEKHEVVAKRKDDLATHSHDADEKAKETHDTEAQKAENLSNAIAAAENQIQKLEYWSDIKETVQHEDINGSGSWDKRRWQGVSQLDTRAFKSKQRADSLPSELHDKPETSSRHTKDSSRETDSSGYTTAPSVTASRQRPSISSQLSDTRKEEDTDNSLQRFVTASEGPVSSIKPKQWRDNKHFRGKGRERALQLDGVEEENGVEGTSVDLDSESSDDDVKLNEVDAESAVVKEEEEGGGGGGGGRGA